MADKVKELYRGTVTLQQIQESIDGTIELYTTDDKTQHVIKDIQFNGNTLETSYITNNGFVECKVGLNASGSSIVDKNSTIALKSTKTNLDNITENQITFAVKNNSSNTSLVTLNYLSDGFTDKGFKVTSGSSKLLNIATVPSLTNSFVIKGNNAFVNDNFTASAAATPISIQSITGMPVKIDMFNPGVESYVAYSPYKNTIYYKPKSSDATISALDVESAPYIHGIGKENSYRTVLGDNGKYIYNLTILDKAGIIVRRTLKNPWDLSEVTETTFNSIGTLGGTAVPYCAFQFNSDGTKLYGLNYITKKIIEITLTTAWDLSNGTRTAESNLLFNNAEDFYMHTDGSFIIVRASTENTLKKYPLSTPFDITTIGGVTESYSNGILAGTGQFAVSSDGNYILYVYTPGYTIYNIKLNNGNFSLTSCSTPNTLKYYSTGSYPTANQDGVIAFSDKSPDYGEYAYSIALGANNTRMYWRFNNDNNINISLVAYKVDLVKGIANNSLYQQTVKSITLNNNTVSALPRAGVSQRLYAEGKYLFYSQNNVNNIYVIDTDTWNVGLLTGVGLVGMGTFHSFSVHYNPSTDEYCLLNFAGNDSPNGTVTMKVCYVPAGVIESVCVSRDSFNCTGLEKYSNTMNTFLKVVPTINQPPVLVNKYFMITAENSSSTANVYDIRTGQAVSMVKYEFINSEADFLSGTTNTMFVSIGAAPTAFDSTNYAVFNKDVAIRITGIEITEEN